MIWKEAGEELGEYDQITLSEILKVLIKYFKLQQSKGGGMEKRVERRGRRVRGGGERR